MTNFRRTLLLLLFSSISAWAQQTVDLQWAICEASAGRVVNMLEFRKAKKPKQVTYYDDQNFSLTKNDIHLKLTSGAKKTESSLKIGMKGDQIFAGAKCEVDRYGETRLGRCSIEEDVQGSNLWSANQKQFLEKYAGHLDWESLHGYGPFVEQKWERDLAENLEVSLEVLYGVNGDPISEISVKATVDQEVQTFETVSRWLADRQIRLCPVQEGKAQRLMRKLEQ